MVNTNKVVGFYTDVFGNEINEYEQMPKYTIGYKGFLFEGDSDGWNERGCDKWEDAIALYHAYSDIIQIKDNEYGVIFKNGEWY